MNPPFYDHAIAAGAFWSIVLGWELFEWRQYRLEVRAAADVDQDRGSGRQIILATWLAVPAAFALAHVDVGLIPGNRWVVYGVGVGLLVAGIAFRQWAIQVLGGHFRRRVTIQPGHEVVRRGPYRVLRHPAYAGGLLRGRSGPADPGRGGCARSRARGAVPGVRALDQPAYPRNLVSIR